MNAIEFDSVTKTFPDGTVAVDQLTLEVESGETMVLIGPSGCGKTTTLRLLAGLEPPTSGSISINSTDVSGRAPADRNVAMMFQSDALYPHMSVRGNLSFGLNVRKGFWNRLFGLGSGEANSSPTRTQARPGSVASRLGIERLLDRKPHQLSGGERQRVALGRAMVRDPAAFLLDEPLSRLDARLADELRIELRQVFRELGKPVLYVTHDQREAMALADRLAVMDRGKVLQVGKPLDIYQRPANLFVANFVGSVPVNVFTSDVVGLPGPPAAATVGIRAEHLSVTTDNQDGQSGFGFPAKVRDVERLGDHSLVYMDAAGFEGDRLVARCQAEIGLCSGDPINVSVAARRLMWFEASGKRIETDLD